MRLKIQEQSERNFASRIIQSRWIGNYPLSAALGIVDIQNNSV
jgi:hypothetical protein